MPYNVQGYPNPGSAYSGTYASQTVAAGETFTVTVPRTSLPSGLNYYVWNNGTAGTTSTMKIYN